MKRFMISLIVLATSAVAQSHEIATCDVVSKGSIVDTFQVSVESNKKVIKMVHRQGQSNIWILAAHYKDKGRNNSIAGLAVYHFYAGIANPPILGICSRDPNHASCVNPFLPPKNQFVPLKGELEISEAIKFSYGDGAQSARLIDSVEFQLFQPSREISLELNQHQNMNLGLRDVATLNCQLN